MTDQAYASLQPTMLALRCSYASRPRLSSPSSGPVQTSVSPLTFNCAERLSAASSAPVARPSLLYLSCNSYLSLLTLLQHLLSSMETSTMATMEDLGPQLNAVVWLLLGFSGLFLALRLNCKFLKNRGFWWDDHVLVASWVCSRMKALPLRGHTLTSQLSLHLWLTLYALASASPWVSASTSLPSTQAIYKPPKSWGMLPLLHQFWELSGARPPSASRCCASQRAR